MNNIPIYILRIYVIFDFKDSTLIYEEVEVYIITLSGLSISVFYNLFKVQLVIVNCNYKLNMIRKYSH